MFFKNSRSSKFFKMFLTLIHPKLGLKKEEYNLIKTADLIVSKGQESYTGSYGIIHFVDSFFESYICSRVSNKVILLGHSIGPIKNKFQRYLLKYTIQNFKKIYIRDSISKKALEHISYKNYEEIDDMAYNATKLFNTNIPKKKKVLIFPNKAIVKNNSINLYINNLQKIIKHFISLDYKVGIASSVKAKDWNNDYIITKHILSKNSKVEDIKISNLEEFMYQIKSSKIVVSSRLHPIILASDLNCSIVALSDAPKVYGILQKIKTKYKILNPLNITNNEILSLHESI
ncbi:MAG: polysaccharide pyruvyl transferase family protein [Thermales bacterium]|nr:polysaccharide pyruvyl transferase family protein [Thermales bacterium]